MATGTDKFLNYNGLVKLIGLIKNALSSAVGFKTNSFVKGIAGYGSGSAPSSTSGVNDTKNKLEGTYTTGKLDGTGTDTDTNKFTYIDTTYGTATQSLSGLLSSTDKTTYDGYASLITAAAKTVRQTSQGSSSTTALPLLMQTSGSHTSGNNAEAAYDADLKFKPSDNTLTIGTASSSASGTTITPSSLKVGTTSSASELTSSQLKIGGKALDNHNGTNDGATLIGYSSSATGYSSVSTVDGALDKLITDVANAGNVDDVKVNGTSVMDGKTAKVVIKQNGTNLTVTGGAVDVQCVTGITYAGGQQAHSPASGSNGLLNLQAVASAAYGDAANADGILTNGQYESIMRGIADSVYSVKVNNTETVSSGVATISAVTGLKNNGASSFSTGQLIVKKVNGNSLVGTGTLTDITLNASDIKLSAAINTNEYTTSDTVQSVLSSINGKVNSITSAGLTREVVTELPTGASINTNVIYMILASNDTLNSGDPSTSASTTPYTANNNSYNEYMYINSAWERIGSTEVNLDIDPITNDEIDTAWSTTAAAA